MQIGIQLFLQKYEILQVWTNSYKEKKLTQMGQSCANISRFQNLISCTRFQNSQISALTLCQSSPLSVCLSLHWRTYMEMIVAMKIMMSMTMTTRMTLGSITLDSSEARVHPRNMKFSKWLKSRIQATTCLRVMGHGGDYRTDMHPDGKFSKKLRQLNATGIFCSLVTGTFGWTERDSKKEDVKYEETMKTAITPIKCNSNFLTAGLSGAHVFIWLGY